MREFLIFVLLDGTLLFGLFYGITFLVALAQQQSGVQNMTERLRTAPLGKGNLYAAGAGAVTPFCSCSTIPVLSGMLRARIRFGICLTFLMASPLVNEAVIIVMGKYFGVMHTATFIGLTLAIPVLAGIGLDVFGFGRFVIHGAAEEVPGRVVDSDVAAMQIPWRARVRFAEMLARTEVRGIFWYLLVGLAIGGVIHGFIPEAWILSLTTMVKPIYLIPLMALLGAPLYFNITAAVPIAFALTEKQLGIGPVVAFLVAGAGLSIPEMALLAKLFRPQLLAAYVVTMLLTAITIGYIFQHAL